MNQLTHIIHGRENPITSYMNVFLFNPTHPINLYPWHYFHYPIINAFLTWTIITHHINLTALYQNPPKSTTTLNAWSSVPSDLQNPWSSVPSSLQNPFLSNHVSQILPKHNFSSFDKPYSQNTTTRERERERLLGTPNPTHVKMIHWQSCWLPLLCKWRSNIPRVWLAKWDCAEQPNFD